MAAILIEKTDQRLDDVQTALAGAAGRSVWIISDGKTGHLAMTLGVAEAMGLEHRLIEVAPRGLWRLLAPWAPVTPAERFGRPGSRFAPPWPDFAFAAGRLTVPYLRAIHRAAGPQTFTVSFMDPRVGGAVADLIWVPEHDVRRGDNVITTLITPHRFGGDRLAALRQTMPESIAALPLPRVAVLLGGPSAAFRFDERTCMRLAAVLGQLAARGVSLLITPSRRTPAKLLALIDQATRQGPRLIWDGQGENPYPAFLAHADAFVVTADSVNMTGEACATGRPVYVFMPAGGAAKFMRFHRALREYGATRILPDELAGLELWRYKPLDAAADVAAEIALRWWQRQNRRSRDGG